MTDQRKEFHKIIEDFKCAMLATKVHDKVQFHARPMRIVDVNEETLSIYFVTDLQSDKVDEVIRHPQAIVTMQNGSKCVSLSGHVHIETKQELIDELWKPEMKVWFEDKTDPNIAIIEFKPENGEYWDLNVGSIIQLAVKEVKSFFTGKETNWDEAVHGTLSN